MDNWKCSIYNNDYGYYISLETEDYEVSIERNVCGVLKISEQKYEKILKLKYNAYIHKSGSLYFKHIEDACEAKVWIESLLIMNSLSGEN